MPHLRHYCGTGTIGQSGGPAVICCLCCDTSQAARAMLCYARCAGEGQRGGVGCRAQRRLPQIPMRPNPRMPCALRRAVPRRAAQDCQLNVYKPNPRQYVATIRQMPGLEVRLQPLL